MKQRFLLLTSVLFLASAIEATRIPMAYVDMIKGYTKSVEENGDTAFHYMGRLRYRLIAEENDSIHVDFGIINNQTRQWLDVYERDGDVGLVNQRNASDTLKTIFFRTKVIGDISGEYHALVFAEANKSRMWHMADSLVGLMTVAQKQSMLYVNMTHPIYKMFGQDNFNLADGTTIVGWRCADGPHGLRYPVGPQEPGTPYIYGAGDTVTLFPTEACLGCSWDRDLVYRVGKAVAKESRAWGVYCNLGPMCDLVVNPRWGRAFETMGEDPYHVGQMTSHQVKGIQSEKVIATPKHFTPYVIEKERFSARVVLEERALRELFCAPFKCCLLEGKAGAIMTCYHRIRSPGFTIDESTLINALCERAGSNRHTIHNILRHDWGFKGVIMTDWEGAAGVSEKYAYETEFDMSMPKGSGGYTAITEKVNAGLWSEEFLDRKAKRILNKKLWAWNGEILTSDEQLKTHPEKTILCQEHLDISLEGARKGLVLVKNDAVGDAPILPLSKNEPLTIAVIGPYANTPRIGGGGSSAVTPDKIITPLQGFQAIAAANPGITVTTDPAGADIAVVCVGVFIEAEDTDRETISLIDKPVKQNELVSNTMAQVPKTIVVYTGGSASTSGAWSEAPAVLIAFYPGRFQGQAIAEVLFGDVNPGGHLNVTFPNQISDLPKYEVDQYKDFHYTSVDTAHGYFFYEKTGKTPLFWFGHGLSYTTFSYDAIRATTTPVIASGDRIEIVVTVTNTGSIAGDDVVQLYVKPKCGTMPRRLKDLRGFARVSLEAGETKQVPFLLEPRDFSVYEPDPATKSGRWVVVPGEYDILAGSTSDPTILTGDNDQSVLTTITIN